MEAIGLELRARCTGCGHGVPINTCSDAASCRACGKSIVLDWQALLGRVIATPTDAGTFAVHAGDATITVAHAPDRAACPSCRAPLPDEVKQFAPRGWTMCPSCGKKLAIRTPPAQLAWLRAELVVAEELVASPPPAAPQPVMIGCLACRAPLTADGSVRIPTCPACAVANYLPDELWLRLHPPVATVRWYLVGAAAPTAAPYAPSSAAAASPIPAVALGALFGGNRVVAAAPDDDDDDDGDRRKPRSWPDITIHGKELLRDWDLFEEDGPTTWSSLENIVMGPDGLFYCGGEIGWGDAVWCMGHDLRPRWVHRLKLSDIRVALDVVHGRVLAWSRSKHSAILLAMADGALIGSVGGQESDDAKVHGLDMEVCHRIIGDGDGTMLAIMGDRLLRYDAHGTGVATWPPHSGVFGAKAEKLQPLFHVVGAKRHRLDVESVSLEEVGHHPTVLDEYTRIHIARDGRLIAMRGQWLGAFDRTGKRLWKRQIPLDSTEHDPASDAQGNVYVRGRVDGDPELRQVVRVAGDGSRVDLVATDRRARGAIGSEDHLCVSPDGTMFLVDYGMKARIIGADGQLRWQSPKSIEQDAEDDERAAEQA